jgi:hypothetical protein
MSTYARKYVVVILANHDGHSWQRSTTFPFMLYHNLDEDMWDDVGSGISHLSLLILMLTHRCPLNELCGLE